MGEWILSRRDSAIVARHEVPGIVRENSLVPAGRLNRSQLRSDASMKNLVQKCLRMCALMLGLIGNVGDNGLYARLAD
jgi:hypothetical protein